MTYYKNVHVLLQIDHQVIILSLGWNTVKNNVISSI